MSTDSGEQLSSADKETERLRLWLSFWKVAVGTALVGIVTAVVNWNIQQKEIDLKILQNRQDIDLQKEKFEQDTLARYLEVALDKDFERRIRFAHYFASLTRTEDIQEKWENYLVDLKSQQNDQMQELEEAKSAYDALLLKAETEPISEGPATAEAAASVAQIAQTQQSIARLQADLYGSPSEPTGDARSIARTAELEGFNALLRRDFVSAIESFRAAAQFWPDYHNVSELHAALRVRRRELEDEAASEAAWKDLYRDILTRWSWGMPEDYLEKIRDEVRSDD